jgi:hypothetical protein
MLGFIGVPLFANLGDMPDGPTDDDPSDPYHSLYFAMLLEDLLQLRAANEPTAPKLARRLGTAVLQWHAALPFTVAERARLVDVVRVQKSPYPEATEKSLDAMPPRTQISGGVRVTSDGPALKRRWLAWRLQRDEFEGQGSLIQARHALAQT